MDVTAITAAYNRNPELALLPITATEGDVAVGDTRVGEGHTDSAYGPSPVRRGGLPGLWFGGVADDNRRTHSKGAGTMRKSKHSCCLCVAATLASLALALQPVIVWGDTLATHAASYLFSSVDIPTSSGQFGFTSLDDINDAGTIVGNFVAGPVGFVLDAQTQLTDIACPDARQSTAAKSMNKWGEIAGFCLTGDGTHGFVRDQKGTDTFLDFPGATLTEAIGLNDDGQVVSDYRDSRGRFHGFFWDAGLFLIFDVPFPDATATHPTGINNVGQIVGFYVDNNVSATFPNGHVHGFLYDQGVFSAVDVPGASETLPMDLNDHGQIVGVYGDSDTVPHSFLLEAGRFTTVEVPFPGVVFTELAGINNRGQLVGRYLVTHPDDPVNPVFNHGVIATPLPGLATAASAAQLGGAPSTTVSRAPGGAPPALRLALDGCPGSMPQPGTVTPAKLAGRWIFCAQAVVPE